MIKWLSSRKRWTIFKLSGIHKRLHVEPGSRLKRSGLLEYVAHTLLYARTKFASFTRKLLHLQQRNFEKRHDARRNAKVSSLNNTEEQI